MTDLKNKTAVVTGGARDIGRASEVANLACYLVSNNFSYLTGNGIDINGGCLYTNHTLTIE